jgi:chitin disaccharide deacetylase
VSLLIISADDWGSHRATTDAIEECYRAGGVTSLSAMVFMPDSARAARRAVDAELPAGLHVNLTEYFDDPACPAPVRDRQRRLVDRVAGRRWRLWGFSPALFREVEACVADQLEAFRDLYGREPTHFDGHEHVHQWFTVMFARTIPTGMKTRPSYTFMRGDKPLPNRLARKVVNRAMRLRFRLPEYFFSLPDIHPAFGGAGLHDRLALARHTTVELMTHPGSSDERVVLRSDEWLELVSQFRVGSYADLT